jgi:hypothetical protein
MSHIWDSEDTFYIVISAEDTYGNIGAQAIKQITIPRNKAINNIFLRFLQSYTSIFPILQKILIQRLRL